MNLITAIKQHLQKDLRQSIGTGKKSDTSKSDFAAVGSALPDAPRIVEKKGQQYVSWGEDNLWPLLISDLKYGSPIHNAIVSTAADMIAGDGFLLNGSRTTEESQEKYEALPDDVKKEYDSFLLNKNNHLTIREIHERLAFDFKEQGACCFEIIFSTNFDSVATVKYVDVKNIRAGKMVNDVVKSYWYSRDWKNPNQQGNKPVEIQAANFNKAGDPENKESPINQLVYIKRGSLDYYGDPDYSGALTWIQTDFQMGIFHLSNIENGMSPSMSLKFFQKPATENDKQDILDEIKKRFIGPKRTGKHMVFFSDGKDLAPEISAIQPSNLDKQLLNLSELCDKKILTGHKLTSPLLAGISISGQLGGNIELETAYKIYDQTRVLPYRNSIDLAFNKVLNYNTQGIVIKTNAYDPFVSNKRVDSNPINSALSALSPLVANKVLESMTTDEIRAIVGLSKSKAPVQPSNVIPIT